MQSVRLLVLAVCASFALVHANAEPRALDTYNSIVDRNPFGLKDPPPPPPTNNVAKKEEKKEDFYLTGISTIGNAKRPKAYLLCKDASKKDYDEKYYNLVVGDRQGDLQLLDVDVKGRRVKVTYQGEEKWLSMKDNGVPAPTGPAPGQGAIPNVPGAPGMQPPGAVPVPLPGMHNATPQPLSTPSAPTNRRIPRVASNGYGNGGGYNAPALMGAVGTTTAANANSGPQTDDDVARQIIQMNANYKNALMNPPNMNPPNGNSGPSRSPYPSGHPLPAPPPPPIPSVAF